MSSADNNDKERERQKLLEDIRKRAEEAELKRIEEEEHVAPPADPDPSVEESPPPPTPPQHPITEDAPAAPVIEVPAFDEQHLIDLRERLTIALDRKDSARSSELFSEIATIIPGTKELASFARKLQTLKQKPQQQVRKDSSAEMDEEDLRKKKASTERKVAELLEKSVSLYEAEKYEKALSTVQEILAIDENNEDALSLQTKIGKAKDLADLIRAEEERQKQIKAAEAVPEEEKKKEVLPEKPTDIWGSAPVPHGDPEFGLPLDKEAPPEAPKVPVAIRVYQAVSRIRIPVRAVITTLVILGGLVAGFLVFEWIESESGVLSHSVLILPPRYSSSDSTAAYLSYALTEQVIASVARIHDLRVIAPTTAALLKQERGEEAATGKGLGVQYVCQWSMITSPGSIAFNLTLHDTASVTPVWNYRLESSTRELPGAIAEITRGLLKAMDLSQDDEEQTGRKGSPTNNPDAYLLYLYGRDLMGNPARTDNENATAVFQQVIGMDPEFIEARVELARSLLHEYETGAWEQPSLLKNASAQAGQAFSVGFSESESFRILGLTEQYSARYDKAAGYIEEAARRAPADAETNRALATIDLIVNKPEAALKASLRARDLDPLNVESYNCLATVYRYLKKDRSALAAYRNGATLVPDEEEYVALRIPELLVALQQHDSAEVILVNDVARSRDNYVSYYRLGRVSQAAGRPISQWQGSLRRAKDLLARRLDAFPNDAIAHTYLALVHTRLGNSKEAMSESKKALSLEPNKAAILYNVARVYAIQRQSDEAMKYLGLAIDRRYDLDAILDMDFYNLRVDPNFLTSIAR